METILVITLIVLAYVFGLLRGARAEERRLRRKSREMMNDLIIYGETWTRNGERISPRKVHMARE